MADDPPVAAPVAVETERQALALFLEWLEAELPELDHFLSERGVADPALIARLRQFAETDAQTREDFEEVALPAVPLLSEPPPQLGAYRLLDLIGQGGMGRVYLAERADGAFERQVAIKLIGFGAFTAKARERFAAECQIMAQLRHPNIVTVLDGGTEQDLPFLVMEYVPGQPFDHNPAVSERTQLRRFVKVCSAVSYAHGRLILHRDLKAPNVLIDEGGEPKLLDFGVAKLLEHIHGQEVVLTATGQAPQTLSHTAPECLRGEAATVQSEVYSLGIMLWQVLTGELPWGPPPASPVAALARIESEPPAAPRGLAADLYRMLRQALHPDPQRRYATPAIFAEDVVSYLENRPIAARRDNPWYVLRKFVRRNRLATASVLGLLLVLAGSLVMVLNALDDERQQRQLAIMQAQTADAATGFITDVLQAANPSSWQYTETVDELLEEAKRQIDSDRDQLTDPVRATVLLNLATVSAGRDQQDDALSYARQAQALLEQLPETALTASQWTDLSGTYTRVQRFDISAEFARRAIDFYEREPELALPNALVESYTALGDALTGMGEMEASIAQLERSLSVLEEAGAMDTLQAAQLHYSLGSAHFTLSHTEQALRHVDTSIEIMAKLDLRNSSDGIQVESSRLNVLEVLEKHDEVDALYDDIMSRQRAFLPDTHPRMVTMIANQARRLHNRGAAREAVDLMAPLEDHVRNRVPLENAGVNYFMAKLGYARCDAEAPAQGKADLEYALKSARAAYGSDNWYVADIIGAIGYCEISLGAYDAAERNLRESYELFRKLWGDEHYATQGKLKWLERLAEMRAERDPAASQI